MKKALFIIAVMAAAFMISSCRSSRPACPAYSMVSASSSVVNF